MLFNLLINQECEKFWLIYKIGFGYKIVTTHEKSVTKCSKKKYKCYTFLNMWNFIQVISKPSPNKRKLADSGESKKKHFEEQKRKRTFQALWKINKDRLEYKDKNRLYCIVCTELDNTPWPFIVATNNFRLSITKSHAESKSHEHSVQLLYAKKASQILVKHHAC